jgi:hypothetical protein
MGVGVLFFLSAACHEQVFSHAPMSLHRATSLLGLIASFVSVPIPWFDIRKRCESLQKAMLGLGADQQAILSLEGTFGGILTATYVALAACVIALVKLV